jgi:hypothetical protein
MLQSTATPFLALERLFSSLPYTMKDEPSGNSIHPPLEMSGKYRLIDLPTDNQNFFPSILRRLSIKPQLGSSFKQKRSILIGQNRASSLLVGLTPFLQQLAPPEGTRKHVRNRRLFPSSQAARSC